MGLSATSYVLTGGVATAPPILHKGTPLGGVEGVASRPPPVYYHHLGGASRLNTRLVLVRSPGEPRMLNCQGESDIQCHLSPSQKLTQ